MRQYTFQAISKANSAALPLRCTASRPEYARAHIVEYYGQNFDIAELFCDIDPPHRVMGEIDASTPAHDEYAALLLARAA